MTGDPTTITTPGPITVGVQRRISPTQHIVALTVVFGFFGLIGLLAWHSVPGENKEALEIVLGSMSSAFGAIIAFYFTNAGGARAQVPQTQPAQQGSSQS